MKIRAAIKIALSCYVLIMLAAVPMYGQLSTATLFGTITDSTGGTIPNATVVITQAEQQITRTAVTKSDGSYRLDFLPVGSYTIRVTATGFKTLERTGVVLAVMQNAELALSLDPGGASETVNVSADVPLVNLGNSTLGRTVNNAEIDNLPLVNRDVNRLLLLTPGVQNSQTINNLGYPELHVLVNGSTDGVVAQVSYYLDGGLNMSGLRNSGNQIPNPDAVSQFNVATNNYSAQVGRYSSAVVSVITKSGSNSFHGSAFEFFRDRNFNAISHNTGVGATKTPYNQHRFGATLGGPFRKNKDFFFASFGGFRFITATAHSGSLPSDAQIAGDFSENTPTAGEQASCNTAPTAAANTAVHFLVCHPTITTPTTGAASATLTPYPNNKLPVVDTTAVNVLKYVKANLPARLPNTPTDTIYTYRTRSPVPQQNNEYLIKTDHQLTPAHRLTLSYFLLDAKIRQDLGGFTQAWTYSNYNNKQQNANLSEVWSVNARTVNQFWLSYTRQNGGRIPVAADPTKKTLADFGSDFGAVGAPSLPNIAVGGVEAFSLTQAITGPKAGANVYGMRDVLTTTRGKHSLYLGGEVGLEKDFQLTSLNNYGSFTFSTTNGPSAARTTNGLSDYIAGIPAGMAQDTSLYANANYFSYGFFVQDDWRIRPNLTFNLGLRYDWQQAPTDPQHMQTNFSPGVQSHAFTNVTVIGSTSKLAPIGMLFPGDPGVPIGGANSPHNHISPRVGFAFDPFGNGKTVFHGAAGLFFGGISGNQWELPSNSPPYSVRNSSYSKVVSLTHPYQGDPTEYPTGTNPYPNFIFDPKSRTATFLALNQVLAMDPNYKWPYSIQINFGFSQQFGSGTALTANYVASLNRKAPIYHDINAPIFNITAAGTSGPSAGCTTAQFCGYANSAATVNNRRPLNSQNGLSAASPTFSNVWVISSTENSNYNGLQVTLEQRLTHRVSAKGFYTWSKTLQSNAGLNNTGGLNGIFVDANYPQLEAHVRSDADRRHMMTMSFLWKPDYFDRFHPAVRYALNGWTVTGIWTANSGAPFSVLTGVDNYFSGLGNNRPSVIPGKQERVLDNGGSRVAMMNQYFDTSVYCRPGVDAGCPGLGPLGLLGNTRANTLNNPGYRNVDASLFRDFGIHDAVRFQLRGEVVNVFNLVNLPAPVATISSGLNFGKITGQSATDQRIIQVGGRLLF